MARTGGKDPGVLKVNHTPRSRRKTRQKTPSQLGTGPGKEWTPRPNNAKGKGARTKKSKAGVVKDQRGANGNGGSSTEQPTTPAAASTAPRRTKRPRTPEGEGGGGTGGRQRAKRAITTTTTTNSSSSSSSTSDVSGTVPNGSSGITTPASTTASPPSTALPPNFPVTRDEVLAKIRARLPVDKQTEWDESTRGSSWAPRQVPVTTEDVQGQDDISTSKTTATNRPVPAHAAGVGGIVFQEGVLWDTLTAKVLAFPVNSHHFMGGPEDFEGQNAAVVWKNNVYWVGEDGELIDGQCCTAHYLGQVMQRCGLDRVFVCDASGVAHPPAGSGLKKGCPRTAGLIRRHIDHMLGSGRRILEVHSRGTTMRFLEGLEGMATKGHSDICIEIGSGRVRVHVFFGVPCGPDGVLDTVVLIGTDHHSMMRFSFVANSIIRAQIVASALAGNPLSQEQHDELWLMSTTGSMTSDEWREYFAVLLEELGPELLEKFEAYVTKHDGDMDRAYQSLIGYKGGVAAPTTKAKRGGEWETAVHAGRQEIGQLQKKPSTRSNSEQIATEEEELAIVKSKLYQQHLRWEHSVGVMHFGSAAKYKEYQAALEKRADAKASPDQREQASARVATLEKERRERLSDQGENSWMGQTRGLTVRGAAEEEAAARDVLSAARTRAKRPAAREALEAATAKRELVETAEKRRSDGATADLHAKTLAHPAHQRTAAAGKTPLRSNVDKTAAERGSTKSTNGAKADGGKTGGEDGVHKGTEGGTGSGYKGAGKKNAELTLGDVMRKPEGLNPGFKELRCLHGAGKQGGQEGEGKKGGQEGEGKKGGQEGEGKKGGQEGAGKKGGRCEHITDWDGRGIPDLRPTAAPGTWVAVVGQHMIRKWVEGGKVKTLHNGGLSPWKGDATTGRSLKGAKGVDYLTEWQAREAVKKHSSLYQEWLKNNPNN